MGIRGFLTLDLFAFAPGNAIGENGEYGSNKAVEIFINLMESPGHRANITADTALRLAKFFGTTPKF